MMRSRLLPGFAVLAVSIALLFSGARVSAAPPDNRIRAPELEGGTGWIGTDEEITLKGLRGKIVVFDFWTLC